MKAPNSKLYSLLSKIKNGFWKPNLMSIELILNQYFNIKKTGNLIQIGSNDGLTNDPLRNHLIMGNWKAILVEPISQNFKRLKANYNDYLDRVSFENSIVSTINGTEDFYSIKENAISKYPEYVDQLSSLNKEVLLRLKSEYPKIEEDIEKISLPSITFDSLVKKHNYEGIDLIHIDAEGSDDVILATIEIEKYRPDIILFEHVHLSKRSYQRILKRLKKNQYKVYYYDFDTIAINRNIWSEYPEVGKMSLF